MSPLACGHSLLFLAMMPKDRKNWSARVTRESHALDLEEGVFTWKDPERIARSLLRSAQASRRRKTTPFRSAMSMLVFYMNRAGSNLDAEQRQILEQAKIQLRRINQPASGANEQG